MNIRLALVFSLVLGLASFAVAKSLPANVYSAGIPVPLCPPDVPTCDGGGVN